MKEKRDTSKKHHFRYYVMHPIVKRYIDTNESMVDIVKKYGDQQQPFEKSFSDILETLKLTHTLTTPDTEIRKTLESIDATISMGHPDPYLYFLFLLNMIGFAAAYSLVRQMDSYYSILASIDIKEAPPIFESLRMQAYAEILYKKKIKLAEINDLTERSMQLADKKIGRYQTLLQNYLLILARAGKLSTVKESTYQPLIANQKDEVIRKILMIRILNNTHTCNLEEAKQLARAFIATNLHKYESIIIASLIDDTNPYSKEKMQQAIKEFFANLETYSTNAIYCLILLKIAHGDLAEEKYSHIYIGFATLIREIKSMLAGDYVDAKVQRKWLNENPFLHANILHSYFPLHQELNLKNHGKALLLLRERAQTVGYHYLDDLFYGRLHLLHKEQEEADRFFQQLIENVTRYQAEGRFHYELQFIKEMSFLDILKLSQGWKKNQKSTITYKPIEPQIAIPSESKLIVGHSPAILKVKDEINKYARIKSPILITGLTGTGKELVARALHKEGSSPQEPFLAINCGALTDTLLQSELFGYVAGAFTGALKERKGIFESAGKGTVFLDEFGEISPKMQTTLLRVLESNEIRMLGGTENKIIQCKIVVATNANLQEAVEKGTFRKDLFFRLTRFEIKIPPLQERKEDIPELIQHFLDINPDTNGRKKAASHELLDLLTKYHWPGNVRELKNEMDRLCVLNPDKDIFAPEDFDFSLLAEGAKLQAFVEKSSEETVPSAQATQTAQTTQAEEAETLDSEDALVMELLKETGFTIEKRRERIKKIFTKHKKLTRSQIIAILKVSPTTATKDLRALCAIGFIIKRQPTQSSRSDYYELNE